MYRLFIRDQKGETAERLNNEQEEENEDCQDSSLQKNLR